MVEKIVKELDYDTILKNVAIVFQKTFLTRDSVLENIRMGSNATLEEVRAAAKEAQIDDFIMSLPDGYDTKVGSFGSRFSGGAKTADCHCPRYPEERPHFDFRRSHKRL